MSNELPRFRRIAMCWLRNPEDAGDAVQDAMLSAHEHIGGFSGRARLSTWITAIVINAVPAAAATSSIPHDLVTRPDAGGGRSVHFGGEC